MRKLRKRTTILLAIALFISLAIFLLQSNSAFDFLHSPQDARTTIHEFSGIRSANDLRAPGFALERGAIIKSGKRTFCDLEFQAFKSESRIIISKNSSAKMQFVSEFFNGRNTIKIWLGEGEYFIKSRVHLPDLMIIQTPDTRVTSEDIGSLFVSVTHNHNEIHALAGRTSIRPVHHQSDDLMSEVWFKSRALSKLEQRLDTHGIVLVPGKGILIPRNKTSQGDSSSILDSPYLKAASRSRIENKTKIRKLISRLDEQDGMIARIENIIVTRKKSWPAHKEQLNKVARTRTRTMNQLTFSRKQELKKSKPVSSEKSDFILNRFSDCMGRSLETLVLRDKKRHKGIIISDQEHYRVVDLNGEKKYPRSIVDRVEF